MVDDRVERIREWWTDANDSYEHGFLNCVAVKQPIDDCLYLIGVVDRQQGENLALKDAVAVLRGVLEGVEGDRDVQAGIADAIRMEVRELEAEVAGLRGDVERLNAVNVELRAILAGEVEDNRRLMAEVAVLRGRLAVILDARAARGGEP